MHDLNKQVFTRGVSFALISAIFWGTFSPFLKLMAEKGLSDIVITTIAPTIMTLAMGLFMLMTDKRQFIVSKKMLFIMALHGFVLMNGMNFAYVKAVTNIPLAIVALVAYSNVILLIILERVIMKMAVSKTKAISIFMAIAGVCFVLDVFSLGASSLNAIGIFWALMIMLILAIAYFLISHVYFPAGLTWQSQLFYPNLFGMLFLFTTSCSPAEMVTSVFDAAALNGNIVWIIIAGFALIPLISSFSFQVNAFNLIPAPYVSMMYSLEPITALIIGLIVWGEVVTTSQFFGIFLAVASIFYMYFVESKELAVSDEISEVGLSSQPTS